MKTLHKILLGFSLAGLVVVFGFSIFGRNSLWDLIKLRQVEASWLSENRRLEMENKELYNQINRLKHDPTYIEYIARKELGMIGKDEIIVKIGPSGKEKR